jgi:glyoxalase family protein
MNSVLPFNDISPRNPAAVRLNSGNRFRESAMQLTGIHHLTAVTANAAGNKKFYTEVLGLRLVKKTVNQDEVSAYHLFYADGIASPGSDITFFHFPVSAEQRGNNTISHTSFRVTGQNTMLWWHNRLTDAGVRVDEVVQRDGVVAHVLSRLLPRLRLGQRGGGLEREVTEGADSINKADAALA